MSGTLNYAKAFGKAGVLPDAPPLTFDSIFRLASCTKLITTIAALQCVERGLFSLDSAEDVARLLPEYAHPEILTGLDDDGKAILVPAKNKITLRMLLTHSSGLAYDFLNPQLIAWRNGRGEKPRSLIDIEGCHLPLLYEPGEKWEYGVGIDWAGQMVERANEGMKLETYLQDNILGPLDAQNMTFHLETKEEIRSQVVDITARVPETGVLVHTDQIIVPDPAKDALGGGGLYGDAGSYMKLLASILKDDGKLLKNASVAQMFQPQLSEASKESFMQKPRSSSIDPDTPLSWGFGGVYNFADFKDDRRKKGSLAWGGMPNLLWVRTPFYVIFETLYSDQHRGSGLIQREVLLACTLVKYYRQVTPSRTSYS